MQIHTLCLIGLLKLAIDGFSTRHWAPLCPRSASLACIAFLFPFTAVSMAFLPALPEKPGKARWPRYGVSLWCLHPWKHTRTLSWSTLTSPLKSIGFGLCKWPSLRAWVMGGSGAQILTPLLESFGVSRDQTLSAVLCLKICLLSHIGSLVPVSWHCALFYNLLPR